ncbi:UbiX family flavin prenyltransferase [Mycobacterium paraterrae]|uniref:Flavin prenyltransferase UbiX n=1 Tax=Mycobacterium paraterrae TaxID=577492 RepID=A0ABY3VK27_9MYCO|nr:UbiX family flavin prenyltransferase [Mycobacterium paraterrae]UMB69750.1 UbiX family flavin prenyltransferase [Mycobacterium paraterrae]
MRVIVAITGATGAIFGIRLLERLGEIPDVETHLIMSRWARMNINAETGYSAKYVQSLADVTYSEGDQGAAVSSGSFRVEAMIVAPCSMRTLAAIRHGLADNLITRAADVILKERRNLVLLPRETPLNAIHLDNMLELARLGVSICPPMPAFYHHPDSLDDMIHHITVRAIDQLGLNVIYDKRWTGLPHDPRSNKHRSTSAPADHDGSHSPDTMMWEAVADNAIDELRQWTQTELLDHLDAADPHAEVRVYHNDTGRVVVIATGDVAAFQPPTPPHPLVRRPPHTWHFNRAALP